MSRYALSIVRSLVLWSLLLSLLAGCGQPATTPPPAADASLAASSAPIAAASSAATATAGAPASTPASQEATATEAPPSTETSAPSDPATSPAAATTATGVASGRLRGAALLEALRGGGYIIYFRHAATDRSEGDSDNQNLENCATQRNLNDQGRTESRLIGEAFTELKIPVGQVLSSKYCRSRNTAEIAFGRVELTDDITNLYAGLEEGERQRRIDALKRLLATPPPPGENTVLVAHGINIINAANIEIREGEAAIYRPLGERFEYVGRVMPKEWATLGGG